MLETLITFLIKAFIFLVIAILTTVFPVHVESIAIRFRIFPLWTVIFICLNVLIYVAMIIFSLWKGWWVYDFVIQTRGVIPYEILHAVDLPPPNGLGVTGVYLNILTSMFLHGGLLHLWGNMQFLWLFGPELETGLNLRFDRRSRAVNRAYYFIVFYLLCGVGAVLTYALYYWDSRIVLIGASGAISGLLGAHLLKFWRDYRKAYILILYWIPMKISANLYLVYWIALQVALHLFYGGQSWVAFVAHIGGFLTGLATSPLYHWAGTKTGRFR